VAIVDWAEDVLAYLGYVVVSRATAAAIERFDRDPDGATIEEIDGLLYALATTRYAELFPAPADALLRKVWVTG
jgi:hypothetical protein